MIPEHNFCIQFWLFTKRIFGLILYYQTTADINIKYIFNFKSLNILAPIKKNV